MSKISRSVGSTTVETKNAELERRLKSIRVATKKGLTIEGWGAGCDEDRMVITDQKSDEIWITDAKALPGERTWERLKRVGES